MKDLRTIPVNDFRIAVTKLTFATLKQLFSGIYDFKKTKFYENTDIMLDIERKETIIINEMQRRGYNLIDGSFQNWISKIQNKAKKIYVTKGRKI